VATSLSQAADAPGPSVRIPRRAPDEARRRQTAIQLIALRRSQHARTRAAAKAARRKCGICKISCSSVAVYREHLSGRKHQRNAKRLRDGPQHCDLCQKSFTNIEESDRHKRGKHHLKVQLAAFELEQRAGI
jgi:ferredoxin